MAAATSTATTSFRNRRGEALALAPGHVVLGNRAYGGAGACDGAASPDDRQAALDGLRRTRERVELGATLLRAHGGTLEGRVLNLGAGLGLEACCLAGGGAGAVLGTNHGAPYHAGDDLRAAPERTADRFRSHATALGYDADRANVAIDFAVDDICATTLAEASFTAIMSWQTLEHVLDLEAAFASMHRLLVPGGWCYHEYNAFFGLDGGHSACTTEIPWGHARLDRDDLARYFDTFAPDRRDAALAFLDEGLNRCAQSTVRAAIAASGLELLAFLPRARTEDLLHLTPEVLPQVRRIAPEATTMDLACRIVRLVARRPPAGATA